MKIMSFNTQHCWSYLGHKIDFEQMAEAIRQVDPDIVGLQEMRGQGADPEFADQVKILSELTGLKHFCFAEAIRIDGVNPYGNGLLSRHPLLHTEIIPIPDPEPRKYDGYYESRCLLKAVLPGGITVLVCHFGLNLDEAENAVATVLTHLAEEKCIFMGDLNVTPENPVLDPIRAKMKDVSAVFGKPLLSYPSDEPEIKIDYIFVSPDVEVLEAEIPAIVASDHRPHTATVEM